MLSDSDAEDEGSGGAAQRQLASPAVRAALTAYSRSVAPGRQAGQAAPEAAACSDQSSSSGSQQEQNTAMPGPNQEKPRCQQLTKQRSNKADLQAVQLQGRSASSVVRDPAKDIARAAARGRPNPVALTNGLSLVPLVRPMTGETGFRVTSFHQAGPAAGLARVSALEPVEFAMDRPPWRRTSSAQSQRRRDAFDIQGLGSQEGAEAGGDRAESDMPDGPSTAAVVTPILTTAQLDADSMHAARAITDYPWHYNFIPAARRAPAGTAGFAASSSVEQERRRGLLQDAHQKTQALSSMVVCSEALQDDLVPSVRPGINSSSARMLMGYSRSLSGVAQQRGLPSLEINGHPVSLSPDRPSSAARVTP